MQRDYRGNLGYEWGKNSLEISVERFESYNNYVPILLNVNGTGMDKPADINTFTETVSEVPKNNRDAYVFTLNLKDLTSYLVGIKTTAYFQKLNKGFEYYNNVTKIYSGKHKYLTDAWGVSVQSDFLFNLNHFVSLGVDFDKIKMNKEDFSPISGVRNYNDGGQETWAIFIQDEWTIIPKMTLTAGLRQSFIKLKLDRDTANPNRVKSVNYSNLVGSIGLVYRFTEEFMGRALFSQGFKAPNLTQMLMGSGVIIPNPDLKPEESNNFEIGVRYDTGNFNVDATAFYNIFKNGIINPVVQTNPTRYQGKNVSEAKSWGMELSGAYAFPNTGFSIYGNINYLVYETEDSGFKTRHNSRSPFWGTLGTAWEKDFGMDKNFFVDLNYMTGQGAYTLTPAGAIEHKTKSWNIANLSLGISGGEKLRYNATLSFRNIFDSWYQISAPYSPSSPLPEAGFHMILAVGIDF
jgi:hemoglobin/transferrin/lactoferrin receptor protein